METSNDHNILPAAPSASIPTDRIGFTILPVELILQVMKLSSLDDLSSIVLTNRKTHAVWQISRQTVFDGIRENQYPEFQTYFGKLPGFLAAPDAYAVGDAMARRRTKEQRQNLVDAFYMNSSLNGTKPGTWHDISRGGRPFLIMLARLSQVLDGDLEALRKIPGGWEMETGAARCALLLLWRLRWPRLCGYPEGWEVKPLCWRGRVNIVQQQPEVARRTLRDILQLIIGAVIDSPLLRKAPKLFMDVHLAGILVHPYVPLKEPELKTCIMEKHVEVLMEMTVCWSITDMTRVCSEQVPFAGGAMHVWTRCMEYHMFICPEPGEEAARQYALQGQAAFREIISLSRFKQSDKMSLSYICH